MKWSLTTILLWIHGMIVDRLLTIDDMGIDMGCSHSIDASA